MKLSVLIFSLFLVINACQHQKSAIVLNESITLEAHACEGICPVYIITFNANGLINFEGKEHVKEIGKKNYKYPEEEITHLFTLIKAINFSELEGLYGSSVIDLSETVIIYGDKRIRIKDERILPTDFKDLVKKLKTIAVDTGFIE